MGLAGTARPLDWRSELPIDRGGPQGSSRFFFAPANPWGGKKPAWRTHIVWLFRPMGHCAPPTLPPDSSRGRRSCGVTRTTDARRVDEDPRSNNRASCPASTASRGTKARERRTPGNRVSASPAPYSRYDLTSRKPPEPGLTEALPTPLLGQIRSPLYRSCDLSLWRPENGISDFTLEAARGSSSAFLGGTSLDGSPQS